jgi:hypothetical protein
MRTILMAALALLTARGSLAAQQPMTCASTETVQGCISRVIPTGSATPVNSSQEKVAVAQRLQAKAAGPDLAAPGAASAIKDFLPLLAGAIIAPVDGGDPGDLGLKANLPMTGGPVVNWGLTLQLSTVLHRVTLPSIILDSLPASIAAAARPRLEDAAKSSDDISLRLSPNIENRWLGRSMRPHAGLVDSLLNAVLDSGRTASVKRGSAKARYDAVHEAIEAGLIRHDPAFLAPNHANDTACWVIDRTDPTSRGQQMLGDVKVECLATSRAQELETRLGEWAQATKEWLRSGSENLATFGFQHLAQLINNQPQLNGSVEYRYRNGVAGANQWTGTARLEMGFANMNGLRHECGPHPSPDCLRQYVKKPGVTRSLTRGDRLWIQGDWSRRNQWHLTIPKDSIRIRLNPAVTYALSAGYGSYFGNPKDGENRNRLDWQAKYDFTRDDPIRRERFVSTLFYTVRLLDQASAVFGVTFANRPEFLGDVDHKIGGNFGLTYKFNQPPQQAAGTR